MINSQFEILVAGRCAGDLVLLDMYETKIEPSGVRVIGNQGDYFIPTDTMPTAENDKVTSQIDLGEFIERYQHLFRWGGGGFNSMQTLADLRVRSPHMAVTLMTPSRPELILGKEDKGVMKSLVDSLSNKNVNGFFMNFSPLTYNIVMRGKGEGNKDNKIVVRNKPHGADSFKLNREHRSSIDGYIGPSDGILVNALNDLDMTSTMVEDIFHENQIFFKNEQVSQESIMEKMNSPRRLPTNKHRKIMTVMAYAPNKITRSEFIDKIMPYTGTIMNLEDTVKIFYGNSKDITEAVQREIYFDAEGKKQNNILNYEPIMRVLSQMRLGVPTEHGVRRYVEDPYDDIYITLGSKGHIVSVKNKAYHLMIDEDIVKYINEKIKQNRSSTSGAGDAFAAGVIHQETVGMGRNVKDTAAFANTAVCKYLGLNNDIISSEVRIISEFDLEKSYTDKPLDLMYKK